MLHIYIDGDACPVKEETYKVAQRYGLNVTLVVAPNNSIGQEIAPFGGADRCFATVTEGASGRGRGRLGGTLNIGGRDRVD
jgi:hypothetical protein